MNEKNEVYWEKPRQPEYPVFKEVKEQRPVWDDVKQVFDVDRKYQRFYQGIVGNNVADKEKKSNNRKKDEKGIKVGKDSEAQEEEYFNDLRIKLKEKTGSGSEDNTPMQKDSDKEIGFDGVDKKRRNSTQNSPRNNSNSQSPVKKPSSLVSSPRNSGAGTGGTSFSKFKNL